MKNLVETVNRQFYLDWIRVLAMLGVFYFHNARIFNAFEDWHIKNATSSLAATGLVAFMSQWLMPLFFLVSGAGIYYALKSRNIRQYIRERGLRLLVPLIFGMLVIVVPQAYFDAVSHGANLEGYNIFQIYGLYLQSLPELNTFHLWFLVDLLLFSVITIPLFFSRNGSGKSLIARLAKHLGKPWAWLTLVILSVALANILVFPEGYWGYRNGGWNIFCYMLFFIFGYLIFANPRIMETVRKMRWISLTVGVLTFAFIFTYMQFIGTPEFGEPMYIFGLTVQTMGTWGWLLAILGFGSVYLTRNNRLLSYANEAVLPFYVLHQTVIVVIGFFVVQWAAGAGVKYLVISTTSFIVIMMIYELLVRRVNVLRFLFGMKLRKKPHTVLVHEDQKLVQTR